MKYTGKQHIISRIICWVLLLQMINISIDPKDLIRIDKGYHSHIEDLSINETESIYELLAEELFDVDIPESDEEDIDKSFGSIDLFFNFNIIPNTHIAAFISTKFGYQADLLPILYPAFDSPPPDFL